MRRHGWLYFILATVVTALIGAILTSPQASAGFPTHAPQVLFQPGDVFAGVGAGRVFHYSPHRHLHRSARHRQLQRRGNRHVLRR